MEGRGRTEAKRRAAFTFKKLMKALLPISSTFRSYLARVFISARIVFFVTKYVREFSFVSPPPTSPSLSAVPLDEEEGADSSFFDLTVIGRPSLL
jgi:hypothetical protein